MTEHKISTGRGGAGNIGHDDNEYFDGEIVRQGQEGLSSEPEYSSGRGGAGNIIPGNGSNGKETSTSTNSSGGLMQRSNASEDIIPETAMRVPGTEYENFHTGRGGEGNVHKTKYGGHSAPQKEHREANGEKEKGEGMGQKIVGEVKALFGKDK